MNEVVRKQYDSLYASTDKTFGDGTPLRILKLLQSELKTGRVLDVGGGDGRNALFLAQQGYDVTVIDLSQVGLDKIQRKATEADVTIRTECLDVTTDEIGEMFDAVIFSFMLHHLDTAVARTVINQLKIQTTANGLHVIATFGSAGELAERASQTNRFYPTLETIKNTYSDWDTLHCLEKETLTLAKNKAGEPLKNQAIFFMAKKLVGEG